MTGAALGLTPAPAVKRLHVNQGEHHVTDDPDVMLTTVLGSCVSVCLCDPVAGVGGMNHFLLPEGTGETPDARRRYGAYAMEVLINGVLKAGGRRERLQAKLFGGGRMFDRMGDVGRANAEFAERFLRDEGITVTGHSLGGSGGRRVQYWPVTGRAFQRPVADQPPPPVPVAPAESGLVEFF